jgi:transcriptional regulator with XRE-family HTH domain
MRKFTIGAWRYSMRLTQADMAAACGVSVSTFRHWEREPGMIPIDKAVAIADKLDVSIEQIAF